MSAAHRRIPGIDLLRVVSMFLIVLLHLLTQGGVLGGTPEGSLSRAVMTLLECAAYCAVDAYAIASGYVGKEGSYRWSQIALLWLQTAFWSLLLTLVLKVLFPASVGRTELISGILPVCRGQYWYFTAYFGLFLLKPVLNAGIGQLNRRQLSALVLLMLVFLSLFPTLLGSDPFRLHGGYGVLWLIVMYILGAWLRSCEALHRLKTSGLLLLFAGLTLLTFAGTLLRNIRIPGAGELCILSYCSPTVVGEAAALTLLCAGMRSGAGERFVRLAAPLSFGVYLIHTHPLLWRLVFTEDCLRGWGALPLAALLPAALVSAAVVCLFCGALDYCRSVLFRRLRLSALLRRAEDKIFDIWE